MKCQKAPVLLLASFLLILGLPAGGPWRGGELGAPEGEARERGERLYFRNEPR